MTKRYWLINFCVYALLGCHYADASLWRTPVPAPKSAEPTPVPAPQSPPREPSCKNSVTDIEFRAAYYYPTNSRFRKIYKAPRFDYELELAQRLGRYFDLWENVSWLPTHGHSIGKHYSTDLDLLTSSIGVKVRYEITSNIIFRLGVGPAYYWVWIHDKLSNPCIHSHRSFSGFGLAAKSDMQFYFYRCNYITAFVDYVYLPAHHSHGCGDFGGTKFGLGIGHRF